MLAGAVDDSECKEPTGLNNLVLLAVESKRLPLGQPAGPEPDSGLFAKYPRIRPLQLLHPARVARALWKSVAAFRALVLSQAQNHLQCVLSS